MKRVSFTEVLYIVLFLSAILLDRVTKWWALVTLTEKPVEVCRGLNFSFVWNRGISWGLLDSLSGVYFYLLTAVIMVVIIFFTIHTVVEYWSNKTIFFELLVLAGAISNFFDRIYYKAVIDFIDMYIGVWHWPTFNVADICIVIGIFGIVVRGVICARR